jgi:HPt (histidine-containing phosphotransfer) domain-containing protein
MIILGAASHYSFQGRGMTDFDVEALARLARGHPGRERQLAEMVRRGVAQLPAELAQALAAWQAGDLAAACRCLHGSRGAAAMLGARHYAAALKALESALQGGAMAPHGPDGASPATHFASAAAELEHTLAAARRWLAEHDSV